ncbi:MAG: RNA-binding protein [Tahibacter sp.]
MANFKMFESIRGALLKPATMRNEAGGLAYVRSPDTALALYAATGCLNGTFYADDETQLQRVLQLAGEASAEFVAKTAIYARQKAHMKDVPALLLATLTMRNGDALERAFAKVIDNGRMLRNFVQIVRSGRIGRKSLGSQPKRLVQRWLEQASVDAIIAAAVGQAPSLGDVIKMVHPKPVDAQRAALYAWVIDKPYSADALPAKLQAYEAFKRNVDQELPDLPFQYFSALQLDAAQWKMIAANASWQTLRMNLNVFARHAVFEDEELTKVLAARLCDPQRIERARVLPYQLMTAFFAVGPKVPESIKQALQDAMEIATRNVPVLTGNVVVAVDVSGSMRSPVTGFRKGATSVVRCVDVAALIAVSLRRANPATQVLPFDTCVHATSLKPDASVMAQAAELANTGGGGTSVSAPLAAINAGKQKVDLLVVVSDNASWKDTRSGGATQTMQEWARIRARCPMARMICIDLQPTATSQTVESPDVLHIGGFSDAVFEVLAGYAAHGETAPRWVEQIEAIAL